MYNSGYIRSITFGVPSFEPKQASTLPPYYNITDQLPSAIDQGTRGICVSACVTDMLKYLYLSKKEKYRKHVDFFYNHRSDKKIDGMSPRNAFEIAQANSLVMSYAIVRSIFAIKVAIVANGPVLIALPVYDFNTGGFWRKKSETDKPQGHHAVTLVGYNDETERFVLRNSWGTIWGARGYDYFPYEDMNVIMEAWTAFK